MGLQRRCICKVIPDPAGVEGRYVPATYKYPTLATSVVYGPGSPPTFALVFVNAEDVSQLAADLDIEMLPDLGLDLSVSALPWARRAAFWARLEEITGLKRADLKLTDGNSPRDIVNKLGRLDSPAFDVDKFYVRD